MNKTEKYVRDYLNLINSQMKIDISEFEITIRMEGSKTKDNITYNPFERKFYFSHSKEDPHTFPYTVEFLNGLEKIFVSNGESFLERGTDER